MYYNTLTCIGKYKYTHMYIEVYIYFFKLFTGIFIYIYTCAFVNIHISLYITTLDPVLYAYSGPPLRCSGPHFLSGQKLP